jgi:hypothetical protein
MKREFEYKNYLEDDRRTVLENSGAAVDDMLDTQAPRHAAPGHQAARYSGSERGTARRPREQPGAERADAKDARQEGGRARRGEAAHLGPGYGAASRAAPARAEASREKGAARGGRASRDARADNDYRDARADTGHRDARADTGHRDARADTGHRDARADTGHRDAEPGYRPPGAGRHQRDTVRLDAFRPPPDWGLDDGGDADYDEDPEDEADADLDEDYDADAEYDADEDYDGEYDAEPGDDADAGYGGQPRHEAGADYDDGGYPGAGRGYRAADARYHRGSGGYRGAAVYLAEGPPGYGAGVAGADAGGFGADGGPQQPDDRTEVLINQGRHHARPTGTRRLLRHWRAIGVGIAGVVVGAFALALVLPGNDATWPSSVALVQKEIDVACENPNVVSEPSQVNFACGKDTRQILWVFSLLTSDDNPNYADASNGRKGLEPITPAQGGDIAWSLNLHHPYDPANPTDSLAVAARAINNIIGGATLTGNNGSAVVQPGLESTAANCTRYTGSSALVTRQGFPAVCAQPAASPAGQAALVSDVFKQWMVGSPASLAAEAGVLFENAGNPGDAQVQAILNTLPQTGL